MKTKKSFILLRILWECIIIRLTDRMIFEITVTKIQTGYLLKCYSKHNNLKYIVKLNLQP